MLRDEARDVKLIDDALRVTIRRLVKGESPWPLVLHGQAGRGKTCAALCLLDHAGGSYWLADALCDHVNDVALGRVSWNEEGRGGTLTTELFWRSVKREPLVVLDELGCRERVSDAHYRTIKRLVDERARLPLVVISNLDLARLEKLYDERLTSRLGRGTVIQLSGKDRRLA